MDGPLEIASGGRRTMEEDVCSCHLPDSTGTASVADFNVIQYI